MRRFLRFLALVPLPLAACAGGAAHAARCPVGVDLALGSPAVAYAAVVPRSAVAYRAPGGRPLARFGHVNQNGAVTVLGVVGERASRDCTPRWYRVQVPLRPNGTQGYVRARDVEVGSVATRIEVDLSRRTIELFRAGKLVLSTTTAIGSPATPTPTGRYYVNQRLIPSDPSGPFGPGAIGVSAFSPVLTGWTQGGPIAIHGTNEPWSIGKAVSNGCLRIRNDVLRRLFAATPTGTPVVIHA